MTHNDRDRVSAMLHTLRGEAFRHQLNLMGNRYRHPPALARARGPSLPPSLYSSEVTPSEISKLPPVDVSTNTQVPGPPPPRSWISSALPKPTDPSSPEWRHNALSFMFHCSPCSSSKIHHYNPSSSEIPSLFHLCLHTIMFESGGISSDMYRDIPRHILREYVRYGVIHQLLSKEDLLKIWHVDGMNAVDGELLVSGSITTSALSQNTHPPDRIIEDWEAEGKDIGDDEDGDEDLHHGKTEASLPPPMHTFMALSATFNYSHIPLLPASITHLALINIQKMSLYLLPKQVPLLVVLELSYNPWINDAHTLRIINWRIWGELRAVALRGCPVIESEEMKVIRQDINSRRLLDVEIIV